PSFKGALLLDFRSASIAIVLLARLYRSAGSLAGPSLVFEAETGRIISSEGEREPWHPASLTKLMTGYVTFLAIKAGRFSLDSEILYSESAASQPPSRIGLKPGS